MAVIVDIRIPSDQFELGRLTESHPGMYVEIERIVPVDEGILPFIWVADGSQEAIEETLLASPDVESITQLTELEDQTLYQVQWSPDVGGFVEALVTAHGTVLEGSGTGDQWTFRLRFRNRGYLGAFSEACVEHGIDLEVAALYNPHPPEVTSLLTTQQRRTLKIAHEKGYFEVPRRTTLPELSDHFGVSKQAVSQRIRRGLNNLLGEVEF